MIFIDSNVPMYLIGAEHPNKLRAQQVLERVIAEGERLLTDAEVFQEILHRYVAIDRRDAIGPAFEALLGVVDDVLPIDVADAQRARRLLMKPGRLSARDAIHAAVMLRHDIERIVTFDQGFFGIPGIEIVAVPPAHLA